MSFFQLVGIYKHPATECLWKEKQSLPLAVFFIIPGLRALMMQAFPVQDSFPSIIDEHYLSSSLLKTRLKPFLRPPCSAICGNGGWRRGLSTLRIVCQGFLVPMLCVLVTRERHCMHSHAERGNDKFFHHEEHEGHEVFFLHALRGLHGESCSFGSATSRNIFVR